MLIVLAIHPMMYVPIVNRNRLPCADTLRTLMPALGHLVHMPSHIDAWVGGYKEGVG